MEYLFHSKHAPQKLTEPGFLALLIEPEPEVSNLYAKHLEHAGVATVLCREFASALEHLAAVDPHVLILNPGALQTKDFERLEQELVLRPELLLVTIGEHLADYDMDRLMGLGVSCHINRLYTKPQDLPAAVLELLGLRP